MYIQLKEHSLWLQLTADDTTNWANKDGATWPCSTLSGAQLVAGFDQGGLIELSTDLEDEDTVDGNEFSAMIADLMRSHIKPGHNLYFVVVGQFN